MAHMLIQKVSVLLGALAACFMFVGDEPPTVPQDVQAAYWKELANYHYIDANLQKALKQAQEQAQFLAQQDKIVQQAKAKLEKACGEGFQLDDQKFRDSVIQCQPTKK